MCTLITRGNRYFKTSKLLLFMKHAIVDQTGKLRFDQFDSQRDGLFTVIVLITHVQISCDISRSDGTVSVIKLH